MLLTLTGIYVISFTTGLSRNAGQTVRALINGDVNTAIFVTDTAHGGEDTATITFLANLEEDDSLQLVLSRGTVYSDIRHLIALNGFLYAPRSNFVAWQLYRTTDLEGPADPVSFDIVVLDTGTLAFYGTIFIPARNTGLFWSEFHNFWCFLF